MPTESGIWIPIIGILVPLGSWMIWTSTALIGVRRQQVESLSCHHELITMHKDPDRYGFGTIRLSANQERDQRRLETLIEDNTRAMMEVSHYIKWSIESTTGTKPPPPTPAIMTQGD